MIRLVRGNIIDIESNGIVVDHLGLGLFVHLCSRDLTNVFIGDEITVYTYHYIKEDDMRLFGFLDKESLKVFELLITVNSVGPKGAMSILSEFTPVDLKFAIFADDYKAISKANGIGAKTAQKIILDLKDKIDFVDAIDSHINENDGSNDYSGAKAEAILGLEALGYSKGQVAKIISQIDIDESTDAGDIIVEVLRML